MPVIAHAQNQHINRRQLGQALIRFQCSLFNCRSSIVQTDKTGLGSRALQQVFLEQASVAVSVFNRHPAFIGKADDHFRPVDRLFDQALEKHHRATTARHHQRRNALTGNGLVQLPGNVCCQPLGHCCRVLEGVRVDTLRQFQIRYRHTKTSRPA